MDRMHYSLAIICHPSSVAAAKQCLIVPFIMHLDSLASSSEDTLHDSNQIFKVLKKYLKQEWTRSAAIAGTLAFTQLAEKGEDTAKSALNSKALKALEDW